MRIINVYSVRGGFEEYFQNCSISVLGVGVISMHIHWINCHMDNYFKVGMFLDKLNEHVIDKFS